VTTREVRPEAGPRENPPVSDLALWASVLIGPVVFLLNLQVNYTMVDWACNTGHGWALHVVHAASFVVTVAGLLLGIVLWQRSGGGWPDPGRSSASRSRLLAVVGTLGSALFLVSLVAHWIPVVVLGPCPRS
jgi:predicted small integral membrane protein